MNFKRLLFIAVMLVLAGKSAWAVKQGEEFGAWKGTCEKYENQDFCSVSQVVFDQKTKKPVINASIRKIKTAKGKQPLLFIRVPLGVDLLKGLSLSVDNQPLVRVPFNLCDPVGCNAVFPLTPELEAKVKKGNKMQVGVTFGIIKGTPISHNLSLSGVTKALKSLK